MADLRLAAVTAVFVIWWAISACNQYRSGAWTVHIRRYIPLGLIPLWTFFAPNPARADSRLVWREESEGAWSSWRELHFGFAPLATRWLVNPELILNKAISDVAGSLLRVSQEYQDRSIVLTSAYVTLLSTVLAGLGPSGCSSIQFAVVRTSMSSLTRRVDVVFLSEVHEAVDSPAHVC